MDVKLGGTGLKLAEAESLNLEQVDEIANLKAALEACEDKWYNMGFADVENFMEPIVYQAQRHEFEEGWMMALQAMGVPDDSPLRNPEQIPFPEPPPPIQDPFDVDNEEDTPSMKELVQEINSHMESIDLEVTSNFDATLQTASLPPPDSSAQYARDAQTLPYSVARPATDAPTQPAVETDLTAHA